MVDLDERAARLDGFLAERELEAVWFARPNGFAWLTGGSNIVDRDAPVGVAAAGYDGEFRVVTNNIEGERIATEEVPDVFTPEEAPWYSSSLAEAVAERSPTPAAADVPISGFEEFEPGRLRQPLSGEDTDRYRELGQEVAAAVENVCRELEPDDTEHEVAAGIRISLAAGNVEAPVVLVGGGERARKYRHYTPTDAELGDYALVSVTAQRGGLYASCTRTVAFDPPDWLRERFRAAARVEVTALAATRAAAGSDGDRADSGNGSNDIRGTAGDVFGTIQRAYDALGWGGEWQNHHQGGAAGYAGREWIARPDAEDPVYAPMAYAWNPTVQGAKSEDTVLIDGGFETLTETGNWPTLEVEAVPEALPESVELPTLCRHAPVVLGDR
ncbi:Xaa-Pro aminopeptidase [Halalkaliarchaeum sp. AArc-CO]|uniref:M24 family metallopeptidase n=1 Tax=unclassified Halalkaliarchaeum TaxID=2678344 RepID=UPI00217E8C2F|nr:MULTISPECIES: M24 family metallopeptidase [unclassified Halalkaliarchaeum]MDR5672004.1 M24 family metallopeptidase [Halalkaliarchaeum sp. AArc-GB]UWG51509.1 Xaa-Pro aminopeptidase [Halalkaliarchaeum sp. AArc-CO]